MNQDFNMVEGFSLIDKQSKGYVSSDELLDFLREICNFSFMRADVEAFLEYYCKQHDGRFRYSDFSDALMSHDDHYNRL